MEETRKRIELETEELSKTMEKIQANNPITEKSLNELWDYLLEKQEKKKKVKQIK